MNNKLLNKYIKPKKYYTSKVDKLKAKEPFKKIADEFLIKEILLSDVISFLKDQVFNDLNQNWILCGGTNLLKCHKLIERISEDIDIYVGFNSRTQASYFIPKLVRKLEELFNENVTFNCDIDMLYAKRTYLNCILKIDFYGDWISYMLDVVTGNYTFYESKIMELSNIYLIVTNKESDNKIFVNSMLPYITVTEKMIALDNIIKTNGFDNIRNIRHFYDIFSWYTKAKTFELIIKIKHLYSIIILQRNIKKNNNSIDLDINKNAIFYTDLTIYTKLINSYLKGEIFGNKAIAKKIIYSFENLRLDLLKASDFVV